MAGCERTDWSRTGLSKGGGEEGLLKLRVFNVGIIKHFFLVTKKGLMEYVIIFDILL